jgi:dolichyl-phosphate-mannose-protein mannosyltransferase
MRSLALPSRIAVPAVVLVVAAGFRLWGLTSPPTLYWDEQYYVFDAGVYLGGAIGQPIPGAPRVKIADEGTWVHPPGGKWVMALLGVGPLGNRPLGWRLPSAVFGIAGVALLYLVALRLWRSIWWAGLAALLLALDGLHIVQSRIAMLDVFLTTFITAGILFLVLDRERMEADDGSDRWPRINRIFGSQYRVWAGVSLGAAVATKWSGAFALLFAAILCTIWLFTEERGAHRSRLATVGTIVASFAVIPLTVYVIAYGAFFYQHGFAIHDFLTLQLRMLRYQQTHLKVQPENSAPWTWPLLLHPIQYFGLVRGATASKIVALGNPAFWWGFLLLLPVALVQTIRRPTWQAAVALGGFAAMFAPWFAVGRSQFFFYMLPAVPFMALIVVAALRRLPARPAKITAIAFAIVTTSVAVAFAPAWTGWWVPTSWIHALGWLPDWPL